MKKLLSIIFVCILLISVLPMQAAAEGELPPSEYMLWIAGVPVNADNAADILGDGAFSYDAAANTLTVRGDCESPEHYVIFNWSERLTIYVEKDVTLTGGGDTIRTNRGCTITGPGRLTLLGGISLDGDGPGTGLTIENAWIEISGRGYGIMGKPDGESMTVKNSHVRAEGKNGAICCFGYFTMRDCRITDPADARFTGDIEASFWDADGHAVLALTIEPTSNPFADVSESQYYYDPVQWAVYHDPQITNGTGNGRFSPNSKCTRAQVVTFLWRAKGCPAPVTDGSPAQTVFDDVKADDYFYQAVLWAVQKGITQGTGNGKFSPNQGCTRGQVVTFLWRAEGEPKLIGEDTDEVFNPFTDISENDYFYKPVLWASQRCIAEGTGNGKFSPNQTCTRGQIVTFLYRDLS